MYINNIDSENKTKTRRKKNQLTNDKLTLLFHRHFFSFVDPNLILITIARNTCLVATTCATGHTTRNGNTKKKTKQRIKYEKIFLPLLLMNWIITI